MACELFGDSLWYESGRRQRRTIRARVASGPTMDFARCRPASVALLERREIHDNAEAHGETDLAPIPRYIGPH